MDVLSEVLKAVKLDGAVFFNGEFSSPWCAREPDAGTLASYLPTRSKHVIIFHLITEGRGYVRIEENGRTVLLEAGDIVILAQGDAHLMGNGPFVTPIDSAIQLQQVLAEGRMISHCGGGGELTKLICGYLRGFRPRRRRRHRQIVGGVVRGNVAAVHREVAAVTYRLVGRRT